MDKRAVIAAAKLSGKLCIQLAFGTKRGARMYFAPSTFTTAEADVVYERGDWRVKATKVMIVSMYYTYAYVGIRVPGRRKWKCIPVKDGTQQHMRSVWDSTYDVCVRLLEVVQ